MTLSLRNQIFLLGLIMVTTSLTSWLVIAGSVVAFADQGHPPWVDGIFNAVMWISILLAALAIGPLIRQLSLTRLLFGATFLRLAGTALFIVTDEWYLWILASISNGLATGFFWVLIESLLAESVPAEQRGKLMGFIETLVGATAMVAGSLTSFLSDHPKAVFWIALAFTPTIAICLMMLRTSALHLHVQFGKAATTHTPWRLIFPMLLLAFIGGTLESGSTGVLPVFALELNFTTTIAAATVAFIGAGSLLGQFPLGYLSDRVGVKKVAITTLLVLSLFTPLLALSETYAPAFNQQALLTVGFLWGFAGGGLYTLAIISVGHSFSGDRLVRVMGLLVVLYTLGASVGPILKTALYTLGGLSYTILLVTALLVTITLLYLRFSRPSRRFIPPPPPTGDHTPYDRMGHAG